jgi:hypothetical protein
MHILADWKTISIEINTTNLMTAATPGIQEAGWLVVDGYNLQSITSFFTSICESWYNCRGTYALL